MVPPCSDRVSRAPPYSRTSACPCPYGAVTRYGAPFQTLPVRKAEATGLVRVRSSLLTESLLMSFPPATEMFQFAGFASCRYGFTTRYPLRGGLPHSEISGSPGARPSPELFAACHVLHRLSVPRHPPDALLVLAHAQPQGRACARLGPGVGSPLPGPRAPAYLHTHARARPIDRTSPAQAQPEGCARKVPAASPVMPASRSRLASRCQNVTRPTPPRLEAAPADLLGPGSSRGGSAIPSISPTPVGGPGPI